MSNKVIEEIEMDDGNSTEREMNEYMIGRIDEDEEDEEEESSPFPIPMDSNTLNRTSLLNLSKTDPNATITSSKENQNKHDQPPPPQLARSWSSKVKKAFQSAPSNTKLFLGIDPNTTSGVVGGGSSSSGGAGGLGGASTSSTFNNQNLSASNTLPVNKTLNHWNQRTFKVLKNNPVFGGKLKKEALEIYIDKLDQDVDDKTDPFIFYKSTGETQLNYDKSVSVAGIAAKGVRKILKIKKPQQHDVRSRDPGEGFEEVDLPPSRMTRSKFGGGPNTRSLMDDEAKFKMTEEEQEEENLEGPCDAFTHAFTGKRIFGIGFCGRLCDNFLDPDQRDKYDMLIKSVKQHRPYFTYWVTFVQIVICLVSLFAYGLAPVGFSYQIKRGLATTINLEKQLISYPVKENFWIGPVAMDLVHLGAKYAPCMRNDSNIYKAIKIDKNREKESACCIRNDRGGCVQTNKEKCSELLSRFDKWNSTNYPYSSSSNKNNIVRTSGSVCGLDPSFCSDQDSEKWPDDITQWPICQKPTLLVNSTVEKYEHMHCEIIGRPCCIGIQGECMITTLEHCNSMRGYFHSDAHLCSQVDCMQDVCGMIDFLNEKSPDQVYRLFTSIFIHAGIIQLLITIVFQLFILRDVEKLAGCLRVAIIYSASGVIGNLGSAIFLPYQAEVGPLGSQFGIIACLFVEMFHAWEIYAQPWLVLLKLVATLIILVLIGFLPMIDNFANIFGFISGLLLSSILFPNINLKDKCRRVLIISVSVSILIALVGSLVVLFYVKPIDKCDWCKYLSCPFGNKYCIDMDFNITRLN